MLGRAREAARVSARTSTREDSFPAGAAGRWEGIGKRAGAGVAEGRNTRRFCLLPARAGGLSLALRRRDPGGCRVRPPCGAARHVARRGPEA